MGFTLCHAQICPHHEHELALLALLAQGCRITTDLQTLLPIGIRTIGPIGGVIQHGVVLVDVALLALDRVLPVAAALGGQLGGDEVAARCVDAEEEAGHEAGDAGDNDDAGGVGVGHDGRRQRFGGERVGIGS